MTKDQLIEWYALMGSGLRPPIGWLYEPWDDETGKWHFANAKRTPIYEQPRTRINNLSSSPTFTLTHSSQRHIHSNNTARDEER